MANTLYPLYKERLLDPNRGALPGVDLNTDTIKIALLSSAYTYSAAHEFVSSVTGQIGSPVTVTSPTVASGVFDAADTVFPAVASGSTVARYVVYKDTGVATASPLIAYVDTDGANAAISVPTNGGSITIAHNAAGIFAL